ncbi:MAG: creatininase family protein [Ignavibacteriales bacterium]|nr:creatininase family protein [Ignavibacteriales bacterium]
MNTQIIRVLFLGFACIFFIFDGLSQSSSVFIEELTSKEVQDKIIEGKTTAIYCAGSTEQNGSHLILGKHNFISRYIAERVAIELGNALVYPIMPFAPTGDPLLKTKHMRYPGSINVSEGVFALVAHDVASSAISSGFKNIILMGDHGGGQKALESVAASLDSEWTQQEVHIYYIPDLYFKSKENMREYLTKNNLPADTHAGIDDTSELLFIDKENTLVRVSNLKSTNEEVKREKGISKASRELGEIFVGYKIKNAVDQIRSLLSKK